MDKEYYAQSSGSLETLPLIPLRGISVFPEMTMSFDVERKQSVEALNAAIDGNRRIFLSAQKDVLKEYPDKDNVYDFGVVGILRQFLRTQDGGMRVMIEGQFRAKAILFDFGGKYATAEVASVPAEKADATPDTEALMRNTIGVYEEYLSLSGNSIPETLIGLAVRNDPGYTADYIAQNVHFNYSQKQEILEIIDPLERLKAVDMMLQREIEVLTIERDINDKLREQLMHNQRENILREQMRIIQSELGDDESSEIEDYRMKILALELGDEIENKLLKETDRLAKQPFGSAEGSVIRGYLDAVLALPWHESTKERLDIAAARKILDKDHFGLDKVKERIVEFLAVRQMAPDIKGGILCLVGPPGVGKTSVAISIAKAMNRKLARMSLGGIHDEAEIRGHRKTYIGAMPGRIMTAITQSGSRNPLLLLDEIDKLGSDYKGDPASALLEALDPEQNSSFRDHFLEVPFDLSEVMFITTANTTDTIPRPLLDRMEIIELTSYTDEEKLQIAKNYLLPKQRKKHGLDARRLKIGDDVMRDIISGYTRESGVRQLERELAAICRKTDTKIASGEIKAMTVTADKLESLLGVRRFKPEQLSGKDQVGVVNGLAWTSVGGEILEVEAGVLDGSGKLELTGNLGDVMKESAQAAVSYIRSRCDRLGIDREFYKNKDIHIHFPEGAIPKDGPSAGITIAIAVISALTGVPVRRDVAMTGEITLTGRILPIGGLKEKTMAAMRFGVKTVIIPSDNERDLEDIDQTVRRCLNFVTASRLDDVLDVALVFPENSAECPESKKILTRKEVKGSTVSIRQ
ncbi:MAG: endopeptidase La [Oscillospiraceae bacterium]